MNQARLRVAVVQFAPKIGHVEENIARSQKLCARIQPRSIDLLCFPEMIFTGYVYRTSKEILPVLEHPRQGPTATFCAELASRLQCYVAAGFPERLEPEECEDGVDHEGNPMERVGANSAVLYGPDGNWIGSYRKTNLFRVDTTWAKPGPGFATFKLPPPLGTVTIGICMDLNTQSLKEWTVPDGPYELAQHCVDTESNILILLNAWLDSGEDLDSEEDWNTLTFWASRLRPLWAANEDSLSEVSDAPSSQHVNNLPSDTRTTTVVVCNRTGEENGFVFAGSSSLFRVRKGSGKPKLLEVMGRTEEGVGLWTV